jgi:hypothetical protein
MKEEDMVRRGSAGSEVIEALEKATGPSRELDVHIARTTGSRWEREIDPEFHLNSNGEVQWEIEQEGRTRRALHDLSQIARYTASVDAALTLIPEGARVRELGQWWDINAPGGWFCNIMRWEYIGSGITERAYTFGFAEDDSEKMPRAAPNAAIALCIAALKARASIPQAERATRATKDTQP